MMQVESANFVIRVNYVEAVAGRPQARAIEDFKTHIK